MPELPEVESLKQELQIWLEQSQSKPSLEPRLLEAECLRADLRFPFPKAALKRLSGQRLKRINRRAKYLLFEFETLVLLSHLGMTGSWRLAEDPSVPHPQHDHLRLHFEHGTLIYNDPRRFGFVDVFEATQKSENSFLRHLGVEPLELIEPQTLHAKLRSKKAPIKNVIMDQRLIVGVGNIYASESLFRAKIHPKLSASRLSQPRVKALVDSIQQVLRESIQMGGSSIQDYRKLNGQSGSFQDSHFVYGREGEPCRLCGHKITAAVLAGRSTYWCSNCQKK